MAKRKKSKKPKLDYGKIADGLSASRMEPKNGADEGLEIIFNAQLNLSSHHVGYFHFECVQSYDLKQKRVVLADDYRVWKGLGTNTFFFSSPAPDRSVMAFVPISKVVSIRRLPDGEILYTKVKRESRVERVRKIVDEEIEKQYKPGRTVIVCLDWGRVPQYLCEALTRHYTKQGWKVSFPADSRGDGGYIHLDKDTA